MRECAKVSALNSGSLERAVIVKEHDNTSVYDYTLTPSAKEIDEYNAVEQVKLQLMWWEDQILTCTSSDEIKRVIGEFKKTSLYLESIRVYNGVVLSESPYISFLIWQYVRFINDDNGRLVPLMEYLSEENSHDMIRCLLFVCEPKDVVRLYNAKNCAATTASKHRRRFKNIIAKLDAGLVRTETNAFFDKDTHYYCERKKHFLEDVEESINQGLGQNGSIDTYRYFRTLEEFITYRNNDLTGCDFSSALLEKTDEIGDTDALLPVRESDKPQYVIKKKYDAEKGYIVKQAWYREDGTQIKAYNHFFSSFEDFARFLSYDLSEADLLFCDDLLQVDDISQYNLSGAKLTSTVCDHFGISYNHICIDEDKCETFSTSEEQERKKLPAIGSRHSRNNDSETVYYVSDIHLLHKLQDYVIKKTEDIEYIIRPMVKNIVNEANVTILIGGDTSSDYKVFETFVKQLREEIDSRRKKIDVVFILGNHDLWSFNGKSVDWITDKYRRFLKKYKMYLVQNNILYRDIDGTIKEISETKLNQFDETKLRLLLDGAKMVIFGGIAFSGYNTEFNANQGIYRGVISRKQEIAESDRFNALYEKVCKALPDREVIVLSHTPMNCWRKKIQYLPSYVYVSGHTHRNMKKENSKVRIYAANQIGYHRSELHMDSFQINQQIICNPFEDFADGIYEVSKHDYVAFNRYKGNHIKTYGRCGEIYMLKKKQYYCFLCRLSRGKLAIMEGWKTKGLKVQDPKYYYDNMEDIIARLWDTYAFISKALRKTSDYVRRFDGAGTVHGCIVDIDLFSHLYVNPLDFTVTPYWAEDMKNKLVYGSIEALLSDKNQSLYEKYLKMIEETKDNPLSVVSTKDIMVLPQEYTGTDIYSVSRMVTQMEKLWYNNVLTLWIEFGEKLKIEKK